MRSSPDLPAAVTGPSPRAPAAAVEGAPHGVLAPEEARALGLDPSQVLDFSASINPFGPPLGVAAAMAAVDPTRYPDDRGLGLRAALACLHGVEQTSIVLGNGSAELLWLICLAYLRPGDQVLVLGPTFGEYARAATIHGAAVSEVRARPEDDFAPPLAAAQTLLRERPPRLSFLCNPNNPTGRYVPRKDVETLLAASTSSLLVLDEAFQTFVGPFGPETIPRPWSAEGLLDRPNLCLLRSLTKDLGLAGLRVGYLLAPANVAGAIEAVRPPWNVNAVAQAAAEAALADAEFLQRSRAALAEIARWLIAGLVEAGYQVVPSAANFFLVDVGEAAPFREALLRRGCCVRDCTSFGLPRFVRIGVRGRDDCRRLLDEMRGLRREGWAR